MACSALRSLLESRLLNVNPPYSIDEQHARARLSLEILEYLSKRFNTDDRFRLVEEKIRIIASQLEYSFEQDNRRVYDRPVEYSLEEANRRVFHRIGDINLLITDLFKSLGPEFLNDEEQLDYVVTSSAFNKCYKVDREFCYSDIENQSSYYKKFRERLRKLARSASYKKEIVDFLVAKSKSDLGLEFINMGGPGTSLEKRSLAGYIYTDSRIKKWFPIRAWITTIPGNRVHDLSKGLLLSIMEEFCFSQKYHLRLNEMSFQQLSECLWIELRYERYFIVMDNLENSEAWGIISDSFPDTRNGCRILFTSDIEMASRIPPRTKLVLSNFRYGQILKMVQKLVFGKRNCPDEFENVVVDILNRCKGSLCAILMVAKYLSTINQTPDNWKIVRKSIQNTVPVYKFVNPSFIGPKNPCVFRDMIPGIISALLKASEDVDSARAVETGVYIENSQTKNKQPERYKHFKASSEVNEAKAYELVGLEECLDQLVPELIRPSPQLEKLAIAGMAGIGKTTLAKRIFDDPVISYHFHIRAWVGISQFYQKRSLLIQLLQGITQLTGHEILNQTDSELEAKLYRCLKGQRYLIIMDDMWSIKAWSELKRTFPDDKMGSRILLTS